MPVPMNRSTTTGTPHGAPRACSRMLAIVALLLPACVPSRAELFNPVERAVAERTGVTPEWRPSWRTSARVDKRVRELMSQPLTADSAAAIAILKSAELQAVYAELGTAGAELADARAVHNPDVDAELTFPLEGGDPAIEFSVVEDLTQLIGLMMRTGGADANIRAQRRRAVARTVELSARARAGYFEAVAAEQRRHLRRVVAETATASAELARRLHEAGNIVELDLTREQVFEDEARVALRGAEAAVVTSREALNAVLGLHGEQTHWRVSGELSAPSPDGASALAHLERDAIAASLELEALRWNIEGAGQAIGLARLQSVLPEIGVGVAVRREDEWAVGPAVRLSLPLFDWGQARRAAAWARLETLQHTYAATGIEIRAASREVAERFRAAADQVERMRTRVIPMRESLLTQGVRQYTAMNLDAFELLVLRREQAEAEERYIDALLAYWRAKVDVDQLRAGSRPGGQASATGGEGGTAIQGGRHDE